MAEKTCEERIKEAYKNTIDNLRRLWEAYTSGEEEVEDLGSIYDYGLCFDYVASDGQNEPYFRYQLSWGGPADEFRFFCGPDLEPYRVEYWFLDWFDGANLILSGPDLDLMLEIWDWFKEGGAVEKALAEAEE